MMVIYNCNFKYPKDINLLLGLEPILISLFFGVVIPLIKQEIPGYEVTVTRTVDEKIDGISVSNTHIEGRAIDIRCNDMNKWNAEKIAEKLNFLLSNDFGAFSYSDGQPRFAVVEDIDGENAHIHLQIRPDLAQDILLKLINYGLIYAELNKNICNL